MQKNVATKTNEMSNLAKKKMTFWHILKTFTNKKYRAMLGFNYTRSKTKVNRPLKNRQNIGLNDNGSLMKVEVLLNALLEHSVILLTCI